MRLNNLSMAMCICFIHIIPLPYLFPSNGAKSYYLCVLALKAIILLPYFTYLTTRSERKIYNSETR